MFTGIIETLGTITEIQREEEKARLTIATGPEFSDFEAGESIAVNGVCLTAIQAGSTSFIVDVSTETLTRTGFSQIKNQSQVNLERSLTPSKKISGHFVSGHVDQVGSIVSIEHKTGEVLFRFKHPAELSPFIIEKGSIAVDGISLTVFDCRENQFTVSVIPFTLQHTNLKDRKTGDAVNIECDMIGKYVYRACGNLLGQSESGKNISIDFLKQHGII
jgi:riboflavin synthase